MQRGDEWAHVSRTARAGASRVRGLGAILRTSRAREELRQLRDTVWGEPRGALGARTRPTGARTAGIARFGIVGASGIVVNEAANSGPDLAALCLK